MNRWTRKNKYGHTAHEETIVEVSWPAWDWKIPGFLRMGIHPFSSLGISDDGKRSDDYSIPVSVCESMDDSSCQKPVNIWILLVIYKHVHN